MEIRTFIGRKLDSLNGILRVHLELGNVLKKYNEVKLSYIYYTQPKNPIDFFSKRFITYPFNCYKIDKNSDKNAVNVISFQYLGDLAHFLNTTRTVLICADICNFFEKNNFKNPWLFKKYTLLGLKKCNYLFAISNFVKNELIKELKISKEKIFIVKCGVNRDVFFPLSQQQKINLEPFYPDYKKILYVGTEIGRKNFLTLLKAFYYVKKQDPKFKLIRVGAPLYSQTIKSLNLENNVIYLQNIGNKKLRELYNLCDLFVFPSLYEGFGLPGLEAASCGIPVICSDIPVFKEIYKDFPLFFPSKNYKVLAKLIIENLKNETLKKEMINKGFKVAKNYSWENSAEKYYNLLKFILENQ